MTVRATDTSFILVSESGQVVPLPFFPHQYDGGLTRVDGFEPPSERHPTGMLHQQTSEWPYILRRPPECHGLRIVTEAEYMEKQS